MPKIAVVGGGASGMMAAYAAAANGGEVTLFEQNEKLGKKLFITGKGRCNFTNDTDVPGLMANVIRNPKFLYSAFYTMDPAALVGFFDERGLKSKVERGNRVFPASDHSSDVIKVLERACENAGVSVYLNKRVDGLLLSRDKKHVAGVKDSSGESFDADAVIIATGGLSYPGTGATGYGYRFAKLTGHGLKKTFPSLVPMNVKEDYVKELMGLSLKNVAFKLYEPSAYPGDDETVSGLMEAVSKNKPVFDEQGEMLFTHFGVSGPLVISASAKLNDYFSGERGDGRLPAAIDLKPALSAGKLEERILRDWSEGMNRSFKNSLSKLLPSKLIPVVVALSEIEPDKKLNSITAAERERLALLLKCFPFTVTSLRGFEEAIITRGGVDVRDIDPGTMESKKVGGLYFVGEVLDLDAYTGGYNLQIAWSTGYLAGLNAGG